MKREYRKPTIEIVDIETTETCFKAVSWHVDGPGRPSTDQGYIEEDKGQGEYKPGEYDPWNPDKW